MYYFEYFYAPLFKMRLMYYCMESVVVELNSKSISYDMHAKVESSLWICHLIIHINIATWWALSHYCLIMNFYRAGSNLLSQMLWLVVVRQILSGGWTFGIIDFRCMRLHTTEILHNCFVTDFGDDFYPILEIRCLYVVNSQLLSFVVNGHCNYCIEF